MDGGKIQALMEIALAGCALAEADEAEPAFAAPSQRQAHPGCLRYLCTNGAGADDHPAPAAAEVARRLAAATRGVPRASERREHQLLCGESASHSGREIAVVEAEAIPPRFERADRRHLGYLMSTRRDYEGEAARPIQEETPIIEGAGEEDVSIGSQYPIAGQPGQLSEQAVKDRYA